MHVGEEDVPRCLCGNGTQELSARTMDGAPSQDPREVNEDEIEAQLQAWVKTLPMREIMETAKHRTDEAEAKTRLLRAQEDTAQKLLELHVSFVNMCGTHSNDALTLLDCIRATEETVQRVRAASDAMARARTERTTVLYLSRLTAASGTSEAASVPMH